MTDAFQVPVIDWDSESSTPKKKKKDYSIIPIIDWGDVATDVVEAVPEPIRESIKQGSEIVGSKFMGAVNVLDKPRGFTAGVWDELGDEPSVVDERSFLQRALEGGIEGWKMPSTKSFGDEFTHYYPEWFTDIPYVGATAKFGTDVTANILGDPFTWTPAGVVTVPFRLMRGAAGLVGATKGAQKVMQSKAVTGLLEDFNIYTGDAAAAQKLVNMLRLEDKGADIRAVRESVELNKKLQQIADASGSDIVDLKRAILDAVEAGKYGDLARYGDDAIRYARNEEEFFKLLLQTERAHGVNVADMMRAIDADPKQIALFKGDAGMTVTRAMQLGVKGYWPHILKKNTLGYKVKSLMHRALPFASERKISGTINEINAKHGRSFFMDDPVSLHVLRSMWSARATAASRMMNTAGEKFGVRVGRTVENRGGNPTHFDTSGNPIPNDWIKLPESDFAMPLDVARVIQRQHRLLNDPKALKHFGGKMYTDVLNWWKKYSLATRPAWHTRNAIGNLWNNYFIGGLTNPRMYGEAAAIQRAMKQTEDVLSPVISSQNIGRKTKVSVDPSAIVKGTGMTRQEIFDAAISKGVYESGLYGSDIGQDILSQSGRQSNIVGATEWKGINKMFAAGKTVENNARLALFIDGITKGKSLDDAALNVRKSLFDYSDLSNFEKGTMKNIFPFYTWTRKNIPAQLVALMQHPDRANKLNIMANAMQGDVDKIDPDDIEGWIKGQFPIFMNAKDSEDQYTFTTMLSYLPTAELNRVFQEPKGIMKMVAEMGSPFIKVPFELMFNYDTFRMKKIDKSQRGILPWESRFGEGLVKSFPGQRRRDEDGNVTDTAKGSASFLGISMTPKQKHLAQSLVLLSEIDRLNPGNIFGEDGGEKSWAGAERRHHDIPESARWVRAIIGARIYKRQRGRGRAKKGTELEKDINFLERSMERAQGNPSLIAHLQEMLNAITGGGTWLN